ncbi:MAG TPA: hypothetical protein VH251_05045 [Verrucomicrobiae bacterium]|jgi:hypothetical protein|nr:hypothetical protein [Verrucomicrobiae bacterium]
MKNRVVLPELLDVLSPQDLSALRSRRELRRLNALMGHAKLMADALQEEVPGSGVRELVELGAGDGHFLLSVAKRLNGRWPAARAILVDQLKALDPQTGDEFDRLGWRVKAEVAEAAAWLRQTPLEASRTIVSNLFFHQFHEEQLREMLRLAANSANQVIALEPRRSWLPRLCGRFLWVIGCGPVTRHDAQISIDAGFAGNELSALWPDKRNWTLTEQPAGLFSHLFIARRKD